MYRAWSSWGREVDNGGRRVYVEPEGCEDRFPTYADVARMPPTPEAKRHRVGRWCWVSKARVGARSREKLLVPTRHKRVLQFRPIEATIWRKAVQVASCCKRRGHGDEHRGQLSRRKGYMGQIQPDAAESARQGRRYEQSPHLWAERWLWF